MIVFMATTIQVGDRIDVINGKTMTDSKDCVIKVRAFVTTITSALLLLLLLLPTFTTVQEGCEERRRYLCSSSSSVV